MNRRELLIAGIGSSVLIALPASGAATRLPSAQAVDHDEYRTLDDVDSLWESRSQFYGEKIALSGVVSDVLSLDSGANGVPFERNLLLRVDGRSGYLWAVVGVPDTIGAFVVLDRITVFGELQRIQLNLRVDDQRVDGIYF